MLQSNDCITVKHDSFKNITTVESNEIKYKLSARRLALREWATFNIRHVTTPEVEALFIDVRFESVEINVEGAFRGSARNAMATFPGEWAFLRNGRLIIQINGVENIELIPYEIDSDVTRTAITNGSSCDELVCYTIDRDILEKICNAKSVNMQLSGSKGQWTLDGSSFITISRLFYNSFYDQTKYGEDVKQAKDDTAKQEKAGVGCIVWFVCLILWGIIANSVIEGEGAAFWISAVIMLIVIPILATKLYKRKRDKNQVNKDEEKN